MMKYLYAHTVFKLARYISVACLFLLLVVILGCAKKNSIVGKWFIVPPARLRPSWVAAMASEKPIMVIKPDLTGTFLEVPVKDVIINNKSYIEVEDSEPLAKLLQKIGSGQKYGTNCLIEYDQIDEDHISLVDVAGHRISMLVKRK